MKPDLLSCLNVFINDNGKEALDNVVPTGRFIYSSADPKYIHECEVLMVCLTLGYHHTLYESIQSERISVKSDIAECLNINEGLDLKLCNKTLDILEAALFETEIPLEVNIPDKEKINNNDNNTEQVVFNTIASGQQSLEKNDDYLISFEYKEYGPYTMEQIKEMIKQGKIIEQYYICHLDKKDWKPVSEIPELDKIFSNPEESDKPYTEEIEIDSIKEDMSSIEQLKKKIKRTKKGLIAAIVIGVISISILSIVIEDKDSESAYFRSQLYSLQSSYNTLQSDNTSLQTRYDTLQSNNTTLQNRYNTLQRDYENAKAIYRIIVTAIRVGNISYNYTWLNTAGSRLRSSEMRFFAPVITYNSTINENVIFYVKISQPDGTLKSGTSSPNGFTYSTTQLVSRGNNQTLSLSGFGDNNTSLYPAGEYTVEVWYSNVLLRSEKVTIY